MINQEIKAFMKANGITQKYLAIKTGFPQSKISHALNSTKSNIGIQDYFTLCNALDVEFTYFLDKANTLKH